ncbi:hypothetical protein ANN_19664 [Periplaneta americana]|uniref:Uncharacterized protein n=1 Tax=Periplaneta americana TaxID=6978 RepID=A0ABQ8SB61_PERAM|nr:hypothetical protein ANN_19664 [Periplaneta americana]
MGESRNAYRVLVGRPEEKRSLGRPRRRWEDNIKMDLREVVYDDGDWINLAQDRDRWQACDNAGEMVPGSSTESYPAFARIRLRENPGKNINHVTCPDRDSKPGHLVSQPDALTVTPQIMPRSKSGVKGTPILPDALNKAVESVMAPPGNKISIREQANGGKYIF